MLKRIRNKIKKWLGEGSPEYFLRSRILEYCLLHGHEGLYYGSLDDIRDFLGNDQTKGTKEEVSNLDKTVSRLITEIEQRRPAKSKQHWPLLRILCGALGDGMSEKWFVFVDKDKDSPWCGDITTIANCVAMGRMIVYN